MPCLIQKRCQVMCICSAEDLIMRYICKTSQRLGTDSARSSCSLAGISQCNPQRPH